MAPVLVSLWCVSESSVFVLEEWFFDGFFYGLCIFLLDVCDCFVVDGCVCPDECGYDWGGVWFLLLYWSGGF